MSENRIKGKKPLWLLIENEIQNYQDNDFADSNKLATAKKIAATIDQSGYNVSGSAGNWMQLNNAIATRNTIGRPFIKDFDKAVDALTLDKIKDIYVTATGIISDLGKDWRFFLESENRPDVEDIILARRIELAIAKAKELGGEQGIRFLIAESFTPKKIVEIMGVSEDEYNTVKAKVDAERAEIKRVEGLLADMGDKSDDDKIKSLLNENVANELIILVGGFDKSAVDTAKKAMEAELAEKKRKEEEEAARKAAEAAGPSLDQISDDDMLEYIENLREILDFASNEKEIRAMCEQSSIPKALEDIAATDPDKLDELEKKAEG